MTVNHAKPLEREKLSSTQRRMFNTHARIHRSLACCSHMKKTKDLNDLPETREKEHRER